MTGELVRVLADDGVELVGFYAAPRGGRARRAVLHTHGMAGNFYENRFVSSVGRAVVAKGLAFLTLNNRGHDYRSDNLRGEGEATASLLGGAAFDRFEDCVHDLAGGARFLSERGHDEIYFEGHSLGTVKIAHYLTARGSEMAAGAILISPPDMFGLQSARTEGRSDTVLTKARRLVKRGRGETLIDDSGYVVPLSAATVVSLYGDSSPTDVFPFREGQNGDYSTLRAIDVPLLVSFGTVDEAITVSVDAATVLVRMYATSAPSVTVTSVPGANHVYWGHEEELAELVGAFVEP
jgi:pimeloyl-ACP methyl ester carboxylesterase